MKPESTSKVLGVIFLVMGLSFAAVAVGMLAVFSRLEIDREFLLLGGIFSVVALSFFVAAAGFYVAAGSRKRLMRLMDTGEYVSAKIVGVVRRQNISMGNKNPFQVVCQYTDEGKRYTCRSHFLWEDPRPHIRGEHVTVYRSPTNYKRYYVDLSRVLPTTPEF